MRLRFAVLALVLSSVSLVARADTFSFSIAGSDQGNGTITASATATSGRFLINAIAGTLDGFSITSLSAVNAYAGNDNLLFFPATGSSFFDGNGVSFLLSNGNFGNIYYGSAFSGTTVLPTGYYIAQGSGSSQPVRSPSDTVIITSNVASTPEPFSIALLGTGLFGVVGVARRRIAQNL